MGSERRWSRGSDRLWIRYAGALRVAGRSPDTFGPLSHLRDGMLSFAEPGAEVPLVDGKAILLVRDPRDAQSHDYMVVDDPRSAFFDLLDRAGEEGRWCPISEPDWVRLGPVARIEETAEIVRPFKVHGRRLRGGVGGVLLGSGVYVGPKVTIQKGIYGEFTEIRPGVCIDAHVHVGHSSIVGEGAVLTAGTVVGGWSEIGEGAWIGLNTTILPHRRVGRGAVVGANSVVTRDVAEGAIVYGNPAKTAEEQAQ